MNDRIRISDADREHVATRLREHFAEGRLSSEELDQRVAAALSAKTIGDLRPVMADLPEPEPLPSNARPPRPLLVRRGPVLARRPRFLPLAIVALIGALVLPSAVGWLFVAFFKLVLVLWLAACLAGIFAAARFRRRLHRYWRAGHTNYWHQYQGHG